MVTHTQYALLVGIPTSAAMFAIVVQTVMHNRLMRIMNQNFDRVEQSMDRAIATHSRKI
jgi:hypothetical protein